MPAELSCQNGSCLRFAPVGIVPIDSSPQQSAKCKQSLMETHWFIPKASAAASLPPVPTFTAECPWHLFQGKPNNPLCALLLFPNFPLPTHGWGTERSLMWTIMEKREAKILSASTHGRRHYRRHPRYRPQLFTGSRLRRVKSHQSVLLCLTKA